MRLNWVELTSSLIRSVAAGLIANGVTRGLITIFSDRDGLQSANLVWLQWLFLICLPVLWTVYRGLTMEETEVDKKRNEWDWTAFAMHFIFGLVVGFSPWLVAIGGRGLGRMPWIGAGILFPISEPILIVLTMILPLFVGIIGGIYRDRLWLRVFRLW